MFSTNPSSEIRAASSSLAPTMNINRDTNDLTCRSGYKTPVFHFRAAHVGDNHVPNYNISTDHHDPTSSVEGGNQLKVIKQQQQQGGMKVKKPKFAFQTRSHVDILDDGYRWRKYGQKKVKNNDFPRSYYRCTYQGCNVKKQVQRLSRDESIVVTTYEGIHTHAVEKPCDNFEEILNQMQIYPNVAR